MPSKKTQDNEVLSSANRKRKFTTEVTNRVCRACEGFHGTRYCYYLFPEKAPEGWTARPRIQKLVDENLEEDPTLKESVTRSAKKKKVEKKEHEKDSE